MPGSGERCHNAVRDPAYEAVLRIGDKHDTVDCDRDALRMAEERVERGTIGTALFAAPRDRRHESIRSHPLDLAVAGVGDDEIPVCIERNARWLLESRLRPDAIQ